MPGQVSAPERRPESAAKAPPRLSSAELLRGGASVVIEHDGVEYTLRLTRQNKLLLTK